MNISDFLNTLTSTTFTSVLIIIVCALFVQIFLKTVLRRGANFFTKQELFKTSRDRRQRIKTLNSIIGASVAILVWFIAITMILQELGVPIAPLLTSAGIIGAALAFGTQSLVKDFVSGLFIIAENQYRVDDYIEIAGTSGKVEAITARTTILRGKDGSVYHVPNGSISVASNKSMAPVRETLQLELDAKTNLTNFAKVLTDIAAKLEKSESTSHVILDGPHISGVTKVGKSSITVLIEVKTQAASREEAASTLWRELKLAAKKGEISFA